MAGAYSVVVALLAVAPVVATRQTANRTKPRGPALESPTTIVVDGSFARYLTAPEGDIDGVVLEDGTVARFAPRPRQLDALGLQRGDPVRVRGDVVRGLPGPVLLHASVKRGFTLLSGLGLRLPPAPTTPNGEDELLSAQHPRLRQRGRIAKISHWLRHLTSEKNQETDPRWTRRQEDEGP